MTSQAANRTSDVRGRRLSVNRYLCDGSVPFPRFAAAAREAGMTALGITRAALAEMGTPGIVRCLADNGLGVSSLNSAGYFTRSDADAAEYENFALIDAAAEIGADVLCVIAGGIGLPPAPLEDARRRVAEGFALLSSRASDAGVRLGLEPIHPSGVATKGCINCIAQALDLVRDRDNTGLIVDLAHSWWDPDLKDLFRTRRDEIALVQLCNVRFERDVPAGRASLLTGALNLRSLLQTLIGDYDGTLELELFADDLQNRNPLEIVREFPEELAQVLGAG